LGFPGYVRADDGAEIYVPISRKRFSFRYPSCPNLEDQSEPWKPFIPEEIGVRLTEVSMMDSEASVTAIVFHHPDCTHFSMGDAAES
jgi:5-methyltetrahydrofolate--homocysteine methyltransferase